MENLAHKRENRLVWGLVLVGVGIAFFTRNFELLPWMYVDYIFTWQFLIFGIGLVNFLIRKNKTAGVVMMAIGGFFFIREFNWLPYGMEAYFWPAILILAGVGVMLSKDTCRMRFNSNTNRDESSNQK